MRYFFLFWSLLFFCNLAVPADWRCFFAVGKLGEGVDRSAIVAETYDKLWSELGQGVSVESMQEMIRGQNPFKLPASAAKTETVFFSTLQEFEKILQQASVSPTEVRSLLVGLLERRVAAVSRSNVQQEETLKKSGATQELSWGEALLEGAVPQFTQDGKFLFVKGRYGKQAAIWYSERGKKNESLTPLLLGHTSNLVDFSISPDGKDAFYSIQYSLEGGVFRVPLMNEQGKVNNPVVPELWHKFEQAGLRSAVLNRFRFSPQGKRVVAQRDRDVYLFSPGERLQNPIFHDPLGVEFVRFAPGRDDLIVLFGKSSVRFLKLDGTVEREIVFSLGKDLSFTRLLNMDFLVTKDLKKAYSLQEGRQEMRILEWNFDSGTVLPIAEQPPAAGSSKVPPRRQSGVKYLELDPSDRYLFIAVKGWKKAPDMIRTYNLEEKKIVVERPLPHKGIHAIRWIPGADQIGVVYLGFPGYTLIPRESLLP